jgi:rhodanese-related sulfurtransferase
MSFETIKANDIIKYIGKRDVMIIDLRDRKEYFAGHIPTAVNIPYEDLEANKNRLRRCLLIFYCDRGHVSLLAARDLVKEGYNVRSLHGGFSAYRRNIEYGFKQ